MRIEFKADVLIGINVLVEGEYVGTVKNRNTVSTPAAEEALHVAGYTAAEIMSEFFPRSKRSGLLRKPVIVETVNDDYAPALQSTRVIDDYGHSSILVNLSSEQHNTLSEAHSEYIKQCIEQGTTPLDLIDFMSLAVMNSCKRLVKQAGARMRAEEKEWREFDD